MRLNQFVLHKPGSVTPSRLGVIDPIFAGLAGEGPKPGGS